MKNLNAICVLVLSNLADGLTAAAEDICKLGRPLRTKQVLGSEWADIMVRIRDDVDYEPIQENANYLEAMGFIKVSPGGGWQLTEDGSHQVGDMPPPTEGVFGEDEEDITLNGLVESGGIDALVARIEKDHAMTMRVETLQSHLSSSRANVRRLQSECKKLAEALSEAEALYDSDHH